MNYLLDTHVFLWWLSDDQRLSAKAREIIADGQNLIYVSVASAWEIAIKKSLGKLEADFDMDQQIERNDFKELPVFSRHCKKLEALPYHHRDPFDRMLVAQAKSEKLALITGDRQLEKYGVKTVGF